VVWVKLPEVPVTVTVAVPEDAVEPAVRVKVLVPVVGFTGLNAGATPLGSPEAVRLTLPLTLAGVIVIVLTAPLPCTTVTVLGEAARLKLGAAVTVRLKVVVWVKLPEVPVTVTVAVPGEVPGPAVNVRMLVPVAGLGGLNDHVTPGGGFETDSTTLPLNPAAGVTVTLLIAALPEALLSVVSETESVKGAVRTSAGASLRARTSASTRPRAGDLGTAPSTPTLIFSAGERSFACATANPITNPVRFIVVPAFCVNC
jgi:hypothetical protein